VDGASGLSAYDSNKNDGLKLRIAETFSKLHFYRYSAIDAFTFLHYVFEKHCQYNSELPALSIFIAWAKAASELRRPSALIRASTRIYVLMCMKGNSHLYFSSMSIVD
jgi:hypothetical protein